jgi:hypothetical protein
LFVRWIVPVTVVLGVLAVVLRWQVLDLLARLGDGRPARDLWLGAAVCGVPILLLLSRRLWYAVGGRGRVTGVLGWAASLLYLPALFIVLMLAISAHEDGSFRYALDHRAPYFDVGVFLGLAPAAVLGIGNSLYHRVRRR